MRHHNNQRKFNRQTDERRALLRSLAGALIERGKIKTTEAKAKELRPLVEKLITKARKPTVAGQRLLSSNLGSSRLVKRLVGEVAPKYAERAGGYTRIIKLPPRAGDGSKMAIIELV